MEQGFGQCSKTEAIVEVNGINLYYEVCGEGEPLFLLHGWTQSSRFWSDYLPTFAEHFKVYSIDLRGHGKTSPLTTDFSIQKSAEDILELLNQLKIEKTNAIGLSFGGLVLLELANSYPEKIQTMILIGAASNYDGSKVSSEKTLSFKNLPKQYAEELKKTHYHGEDQINALFNPNLNYQISLTNEDLKAFKFSTLIINGDQDELLGIDPAFELHRNIPNSSLWIVPGTGHLAITGSNKKSFLINSLKFLKFGNEATDSVDK